MRISIVVAMSTNRVIGRDAALPWHLPADLKRFKQITWGHPIIMGRATHRSIGRALPGRTNIVVTRDPGAVAAGCLVVGSFAAALEAASPAADAMIIGGHRIYRAALPRAERIYLTEVRAELEGDVYFPELSPDAWREVAREDFAADEQNPHNYSFVILHRH